MMSGQATIDAAVQPRAKRSTPEKPGEGFAAAQRICDARCRMTGGSRRRGRAARRQPPHLRRLLEEIAPRGRRPRALILGEHGSGKELVAGATRKAARCRSWR
jgi:DNA-binding NtrC family response regulator